MFEDIGELEHVIDLLGDLANHPNPIEKLRYIEIQKAVDAVALKVHEMENESGIKEGTSHQSETLIKLLWLLKINDRADKLRANFDEIKDAICKVYAISLRSDVDVLGVTVVEKNAEITALKPLAESAEARKKQIKEWARKGGDSLKKYNNVDHQRWISHANDLKEKNSKLSTRAIADRISKADKSKASAETIRKYLATNWVASL